MIDHLRRAGRFFALTASVPFVVGFVGAWSAGFGFLLFILGIPAALITLIAGTGVWAVRGFNLPVESGKHRALAISIAPALLFITLAVALPLLRGGSFIGSLTRLLANHSHYQAIVAKAEKSRKSVWYENDRGVTYSTDLGPPVRVAFNPAGMLDNWSGIIYDPTGDVMLAKGFDPKAGKFFAPDRVTKLFNGDLLWCRHLFGSYYDCSFT